MIYFLTKRTDHDPIIYKTPKIAVCRDLEKVVEVLTHKVLDFDVEANAKKYHQTELLLVQIGTKELKVVIDMTEPDHLKGWRQEVIDCFNLHITPQHLFLGHNLKYDYNVCTPYGFKLPDLFDTMIAEQRYNLGLGLTANYKDTYERRLQKFFPEDKEIRKDFMKMNKYSKFLLKHILYGAGDVGETTDIATVQKKLLAESKQDWFVRNVEFPLVKLLSEIELKGLHLDEVKWQTLITTKKKKKLETAIKLDEEIRTLGKGNLKVTGGKYSNKRRSGEITQIGLFGDNTIIENKNLKNINYNSPNEVESIIGKLGFPVPSYVVTKDKYVKDKLVEKRGQVKESLKEEVINTYILANPTIAIRPFLECLLEYKGLQKFISSYGLKFLHETIVKNNKIELGFKNPVTGRVHTVLRQCTTDNGRLASGEKDEGLFNIQNLPAEKEVRQAFCLTQEEIDLGYWISTVDWSGAEGVIMAALANEQKLYNLAADKIIDGKKVEGDLHSPIATKCWRAVYTYRLSKQLVFLEGTKIPLTKEQNDAWFTIQDSKGKKYVLIEDFLVDKHNNKQLRTDFKSMTFGIVYQMMSKKGGETLNIPKDDAQVIIDVVKAEFPLVFKMIDQKIAQAFRYGYVVFNTRSNNRRSFAEVLEILATINQSKYSDEAIIAYVKEKLGFSKASSIAAEAANVAISGTQADMLKEAMVEVRKHPDYIKSKAAMLGSIHDELVTMHIGKEFGETIKRIMIEVADRYLSIYSDNIRMGADLQILHSWNK